MHGRPPPQILGGPFPQSPYKSSPIGLPMNSTGGAYRVFHVLPPSAPNLSSVFKEQVHVINNTQHTAISQISDGCA